MKKYNHFIGRYGEETAEEYLKANNYTIIYHNFSYKLGEIDLIALNDNVLCFIEVKSRYTLLYGMPRESVTCSKRNKIYRAAEYFLSKNKISNINCRFDVVEVCFNHNDNSKIITLLKNAF